MIHISPWETTSALAKFSAKNLRASGVLFLYGPFFRGNGKDAPSNLAFDQSLRERNPQWGVRKLAEVLTCFEESKLRLREKIPMPANNSLLVFGLL